MSPSLFAQYAICLALAMCVIGFLACIMIVAINRADTVPWHLHQSLCRWAAVAFAGCALLLVDAAMGPKAPLPIVAEWGGSIGLGAVVSLWLLSCAGGFACSRALHSYRVSEFHRRWAHRPFSLGVFCLLGMLLLSAGGCSSGSADPFVQGMNLTYNAVAPEYVTYIQADATLDAAAKARRARTVQAWRASIDEKLNPGASTNGPTTQPIAAPAQ